jgi:hypothetical protein
MMDDMLLINEIRYHVHTLAAGWNEAILRIAYLCKPFSPDSVALLVSILGKPRHIT